MEQLLNTQGVMEWLDLAALASDEERHEVSEAK